MAAAGAGGRAAAAAAAAAAARRGRRRGRAGAAEEETAAAAGAECPGCRHPLCLGCLQRCAQGPGRCCPLCRGRRRRLCGRARCRQRRRVEPAAAAASGAAGGGAEQRPPEPDFIFRAPIKLSKPGELREEYESQLRKLREEKLQEEKTSEELIHKLLLDEAEGGKRKMEEQQKKEESLVLKVNQECRPERLSDSENEEPFQGKQAHRSAFVSKSSAYSFAFLSGTLSSTVERSRSCNDTVQERSKSRQRSAPANKAKVPPVPSASTPLLGVLSSTQNNRCLSAPDLSAEKRPAPAAAASLPAPHKPERSISPESNDSISEELNHFKPIVCSPCTPPKRLPDGRVLSPLIIKSTPRNLSRSLQKPTTYEASPRILKKWEQIFQERQIKRTLSKATLTSSASEAGDEVPAADATNCSSCVKERPLARDEHVPPDTAGDGRNPELDFCPCVSETEPGRGEEKGRASQALTANDGSTGAAARAKGAPLNARVSEAPDRTVSAHTDKSFPGPKLLSRRVLGVGTEPLETPAKQQLKQPQRSERLRVQNSSCNSCGGAERPGAEQQPPAARRGRKRRCKTKHLEHKGLGKRLRPGDAGGLPARDAEQRRLQEEQDRRLALQLQRVFDSENRTVERRKGRAERYPLRSKSTLGAK